MGVGPNYGLNKGMLAQGSTAYAFGEFVTPGTVEQSVTRAPTANASVGFVCTENVDAVKVQTGKVIVGCAFLGIVRVQCGAAVAKNDRITNDATARGIKQTTAGGVVHGIALTATANAGEHFDMLLTPGATL